MTHGASRTDHDVLPEDDIGLRKALRHLVVHHALGATSDLLSGLEHDERGSAPHVAVLG
jgi:hypothetical protein